MTRHDPDRDMRILSFVEQTIIERGYPPSVREIGRFVGLASTAAVQFHIDKLVKRGLLLRDDTMSRSLRLPKGTEAPALYPRSRDYLKGYAAGYQAALRRRVA